MEAEVQTPKKVVKPVNPVGRTSTSSQVEVLEPLELTPFISNLDITTDSVVAKVSFETDAATRQVLIDWGDLQTDRIRVRPGINTTLTPVNSPNPLPDGTYEVFHAYEPEDGYQRFQRQVSLHITDHDGSIDIRSATITLTPRYRVNVYQTTVRLLDPCDFTGNQGDFRITMEVAGNPAGRWRWTPSNNFFSESQRVVLPGSQFNLELDLDNAYAGYIMDFVEKDGFLNADDHGRFRNSLTVYSTESGQLDRDVTISDPVWGSCRVNVRHYIEVSLIRPLPSIGQRVSYFKAQA